MNRLIIPAIVALLVAGPTWGAIAHTPMLERKCPEGTSFGSVNYHFRFEICHSDVDEVLPYLNDKLRYISKFPVCFPNGIEKARIYEAVRVRVVWRCQSKSA